MSASTPPSTQPDLFGRSALEPTSASPTQEAPATEEKKDESPALVAWMRRRDQLSAIPLAQTLEALGALPNQDRDRNKWKLPGLGNIVVKGQRWMNGNLHLPGFGSVALVKHGLDIMDTPKADTQAMKWLAERFPDVLAEDWTGPAEEDEEEEKGFAPPERADEQIEAVKDYLISKRGLPAAQIDREVAAGRLYATVARQKNDETNQWSDDVRAVFVGPGSAELRSTDPKGFKGCCTGSDSERSGYQVMFQGESDRVLGIVEAAVDALSYNALHPGRYTFSTNGAGRFDLQYKLTLEAWANGFTTALATDADLAGDEAAQNVFNALFLRDHLAQEAGVTPEQVDEWILARRILIAPPVSPHQLFMGDAARESWPVRRQMVDPANPEKVISVDTGEVAPPTLGWRLTKACGPLKLGRYDRVMTAEDTRRVLDTYRIYRDRPEHVKDWNEAWKQAVAKDHDLLVRTNTLFKSAVPHVAPAPSAARPVVQAAAPATQQTTSVSEPPVSAGGPTGRFQRTVRR